MFKHIIDLKQQNPRGSRIALARQKKIGTAGILIRLDLRTAKRDVNTVLTDREHVRE